MQCSAVQLCRPDSDDGRRARQANEVRPSGPVSRPTLMPRQSPTFAPSQHLRPSIRDTQLVSADNRRGKRRELRANYRLLLFCNCFFSSARLERYTTTCNCDRPYDLQELHLSCPTATSSSVSIGPMCSLVPSSHCQKRCDDRARASLPLATPVARQTNGTCQNCTKRRVTGQTPPEKTG